MEVLEVATLQVPELTRSSKKTSRQLLEKFLNKKRKQNAYPEAMGTSTLILGRVFRGLGAAILGCFGAFSVGTGEEVQVRFEVYATALPWMLAGSWVCLERLSVRGGESTSSTSLDSSLSSSSSSLDFQLPLSPPFASPSWSCAPLGIEYVSV